LGFEVRGFGLRCSGFGSWAFSSKVLVSGFVFRVSGFEKSRILCFTEAWVLGFGSRVSDVRFRISGFRFAVSSFGFRIYSFEFRASGLRFRGHCSKGPPPGPDPLPPLPHSHPAS
jgi:hypothetical protein